MLGLFIVLIIYLGTNLGVLIHLTKPFYLIPRFLNPPEDLYKPIVYDNFDFHKIGFSKSYKLNYKYFDTYEIEIVDKEKKIPSGFLETNKEFSLDGKIKIEFFSNDNLIYKKIVNDVVGGAFNINDFNFYETVVLLTFDIPIDINYFNNLSMKLTVLEPIAKLPESYLKISVKVFPTH